MDPRVKWTARYAVEFFRTIQIIKPPEEILVAVLAIAYCYLKGIENPLHHQVQQVSFVSGCETIRKPVRSAIAIEPAGSRLKAQFTPPSRLLKACGMGCQME